MKKQDILKEISNNRVNGNYPGEENERWIDIEELENKDFFIIYQDNGGDSYIQFAKDETSFQELMQSIIIEGNTNCDFDTSIALVVKNGEKYTPTIT